MSCCQPNLLAHQRYLGHPEIWIINIWFKILLEIYNSKRIENIRRLSWSGAWFNGVCVHSRVESTKQIHIAGCLWQTSAIVISWLAQIQAQKVTLKQFFWFLKKHIVYNACLPNNYVDYLGGFR